MSNRERGDSGQYRPEYTDKAFLDAVRENEPATTSEIAAAVRCVRQSADYRLRQLREEGLVTNKKVGPSLVWMLEE